MRAYRVCTPLRVRVAYACIRRDAGIGKGTKEGRGGRAHGDDDGPPALSALARLFSLYGPAMNTSRAGLSRLLRRFARSLTRSFARSFVRSLARWFARSSIPSFPPLRAARTFPRSFPPRVAARGIRPAIRFVRARSPAFPIDRSNGTLPHPRFSIRSGIEFFSPVCTLPPASFASSCTSSSSSSSSLFCPSNHPLSLSLSHLFPIPRSPYHLVSLRSSLLLPSRSSPARSVSFFAATPLRPAFGLPLLPR